MIKQLFKIFLYVQLSMCFLMGGLAQAYWVSSTDKSIADQWIEDGADISMVGMAYSNNDRFDDNLFQTSNYKEFFYDLAPTDTNVDDIDLYFSCDSSISSRFSGVTLRHRSSLGDGYEYIRRGKGENNKGYTSVYNVNKNYRKMEVISVGATTLNRELRGIRLTHISDSTKNKTLYCASKNPFSLNWNTDVIQEINLELHEIIGFAGRRIAESKKGVYRLGFLTRLHKTQADNTSYYASSGDKSNLNSWDGVHMDEGDQIKLEGMPYLRTKDESKSSQFLDVFNSSRKDMHLLFACKPTSYYALQATRFRAKDKEGRLRSFPQHGNTSIDIPEQNRFDDFHDYDRVKLVTVNSRAYDDDVAMYGKYRGGLSVQGQDLEHYRRLIGVVFYDDHDPSRGKKCVKNNAFRSVLNSTGQIQEISLRGKDIIGVAGLKRSSGIQKLAFITVYDDDADRIEMENIPTKFYGGVPSPSDLDKYYYAQSAVPNIATHVKMDLCGVSLFNNGFKYKIDGVNQKSIYYNGVDRYPHSSFDGVDMGDLSGISVTTADVKNESGQVVNVVTNIRVDVGSSSKDLCTPPNNGASIVGNIKNEYIYIDRNTESLVGIRVFVSKSSGRSLKAISFIKSKFKGYHQMEDGRRKFVAASDVLSSSKFYTSGSYTLKVGNEAAGLSDAVSRHLSATVHDGEYIKDQTLGNLIHHSTDNDTKVDVKEYDDGLPTYIDRIQNVSYGAGFIMRKLYYSVSNAKAALQKSFVEWIESEVSKNLDETVAQALESHYESTSRFLATASNGAFPTIQGSLAEKGSWLRGRNIQGSITAWYGIKIPVKFWGLTGLSNHHNFKVTVGLPFYPGGDTSKRPIVGVKVSYSDLIRHDKVLSTTPRGWITTSTNFVTRFDRNYGVNFKFSFDGKKGGSEFNPKKEGTGQLFYVAYTLRPGLEFIATKKTLKQLALECKSKSVSEVLSKLEGSEAYKEIAALTQSKIGAKINVTDMLSAYPCLSNENLYGLSTDDVISAIEVRDTASIRMGLSAAVVGEVLWDKESNPEGYKNAFTSYAVMGVLSRALGLGFGAEAGKPFFGATAVSLVGDAVVSGMNAKLGNSPDAWRVAVLAPEITISQVRKSWINRWLNWIGLATTSANDDHVQLLPILVYKMYERAGGQNSGLVSDLIFD